MFIRGALVDNPEILVEDYEWHVPTFENSMKNKLRFPDKTKVHCFKIVLTKVLFQFRASETHYKHQTAPIGVIYCHYLPVSVDGISRETESY
jgi:hypothetical protein